MDRMRIRLIRLLIVVGLIALWEIYARLFGNSSLIAPPSQVALALWPKVFGDPRVLAAVEMALVELLIAFALSVVAGTVLGVLIGLTDLGRRTAYPFVLLLYAIPQVILLPLFMLVFGIGPAGKIAFGFSHGIFPILVNTVAGMRNVNPLLVRGTAALGASRAQVVRYVMLPHMATTVFASLRLAMTMTLLGVILAELFVSTAGIGFFTQLYAENLQPAALLALIATLAVMAIVLNECVRVAEGRFTRWKE